MKDEQLRNQINELIRDEIQEGINEYIDTQEESEKTVWDLFRIKMSS